MESGNPLDRVLSEVRRRLQITEFFSQHVNPIKSQVEQNLTKWWDANPVRSSVDRLRPLTAVRKTFWNSSDHDPF